MFTVIFDDVSGTATNGQWYNPVQLPLRDDSDAALDEAAAHCRELFPDAVPDAFTVLKDGQELGGGNLSK